MEGNTLIEFKNAGIFQQDTQVLTEVNLRIQKGELVYLIGKVGSGKSSLIKSIYAEPHLKQGELQVGEFNVHSIKEKEIPFLRRKIGIVFQDFQLLTDRDIKDNLVFVLKATGWKKKSLIDHRINEVLEKVNLLDKIHKMPHQLSGGEQQRVVIARALLNNPDIIVADEPTGNLDPETSLDILNTLIEIQNAGRAVLIATHDYALIEHHPSTTYRCEDGKVNKL